MRTDGELNRHFDKLKKDKEIKNVYDPCMDEMITQAEFEIREKERWGRKFNATP